MIRTALAATICLLAWPAAAAQDDPSLPGRTEPELRALAGRDPSRLKVEGAGLTRDGHRIWALEPIGPLDRTRPRLVLIGGLDGTRASAGIVLEVLRWWFTDPAAADYRERWQLAGLPCARPDACDAVAGGPPGAGGALTFPPAAPFFDGKTDPLPQHLWRWATLQGPTVLVEVRSAPAASWQANRPAMALVQAPSIATPGSMVAAFGEPGSGAAWSAPAPALVLATSPGQAVPALQRLLAAASTTSSPLRAALLARTARSPLDVARLLASRYPAEPIMSYIPALAWSGALRLAGMTGEPRFREKPLAEMAPFLEGEKPALAEPYLLTSIAGHLAFADLAAEDGRAEAAALARRAADFILPDTPNALVRFARAWTDDMFMATSVLARVARTTGDSRYADAVGRLLTAYAADLQRPDGLFVHAKEGPHAWGRGNGFAVFGLMEALTYLPDAWPHRAAVLASYRAHAEALRAHQAADGMWRQVLDEPGSYREFTATAMIVTAMARGLRLGWLDASYRPVVDRGWLGLLARIGEDGTLLDVCTGTGSGPTREYYLARAGLAGADDRGGAMGLTAAIEMAALTGR